MFSLFHFLLSCSPRTGCQYQPSLFKAFCVVLFNQLFIILPGLLLLDRWTKSGALLPGVVVGIRMEEELPDIYELIWTFGGALVFFLFFFLLSLRQYYLLFLIPFPPQVGSEVGFFYSHYLLHHPKLYAPIHKIHHEFKATTGMAALYAHPIEAFFGYYSPFIFFPLWFQGCYLGTNILILSYALCFSPSLSLFVQEIHWL